MRADRLDTGDLLAALKTGAYFSTQGPRFPDVEVVDGRARGACSPVRSIALTGIHGWRSDVATGERLEAATLDLGKLRSPYWRLTIADVDGRRAWTSPSAPRRSTVPMTDRPAMVSVLAEVPLRHGGSTVRLVGLMLHAIRPARQLLIEAASVVPTGD